MVANRETEYKKNLKFMRKTVTLDNHTSVEGYNFEDDFNFDDFLNSFATTGIQATNLYNGIEIVRMMIKDEAKIFLSITSNMTSSGLRDIITFLVKHKYVHAIVTSAGGVEEDVIKTMRPFVIGNFDIPGRVLFESGVGRIGNIFAPFDRYLYFEKFMNPFFDYIYEIQKKRGTPFTPSEFIKELGFRVNHEESYLFWAAKNDIPIFCPGFTDGSIGDLFVFQRQKRSDFYIDVVGDHKKIVDMTLNMDKTGAIILGGGISKHYVLNANIFREGLDYAVYITTAHEFDASDSGGNQEEAKTWAKIKINAPTVKIKTEASIAFPLLVAGSFAKDYHNKKEAKKSY
ncbi:MAG: deoxyhypusine synthase [Nanoarchaeota archaeon]|nr:deoxyhypusine synthase [Nanoarchaeota archaeon]MBU1269583.1 deoxyhypusine synthase [Nanoarchaeota archaeon]MBU1604685.1 deoxyhypusine synthase [Nanoarchaeota archaeon]MBU2443844.1 deoxyhypusine synthase [Nanoarchaeota archaeon]